MNPAYVVCSPQEYRIVAELMKDGPDNATIGRRLGISEETVKTHLKGVYRKCPVQVNRTALVVAIFRDEVKIVTPGHLAAVA